MTSCSDGTIEYSKIGNQNTNMDKLTRERAQTYKMTGLQRGRKASNKWLRRTSTLECWSVFLLSCRLGTTKGRTWVPDQVFGSSWGARACVDESLWNYAATKPIKEFVSGHQMQHNLCIILLYTLNWVQNDVGHFDDSSQWNSAGELWHPLLAWVLWDAWLWLSDQEERPLSSSSLAAIVLVSYLYLIEILIIILMNFRSKVPTNFIINARHSLFDS